MEIGETGSGEIGEWGIDIVEMEIWEMGNEDWRVD